MSLAPVGRAAPAVPSLVWSPHPILAAQDRRLIYVPWGHGETIARYLDRVGIDPDLPSVLAVDGRIVPRHLWAIARPKPGTLITLRALAQGGDDSNPLAAVAMIALAIFAPGIGNALAGAFGLGASTVAFAGVTYGTLFAGAVVLVGGMVVNALFAPPTPQLSQGRAPETSPTYSLSGGQNQMRPYGPLPLVLGRHRIYPDLASRPYTEFAGDDQFLIQLCNFGYGTLRLSDIRIGQTPITSYTYIITEESGADGILYRFPGNVDSTAGGTLGSGTPAVEWPTETDDTAYIVRTSGANAIRLAVDIEATIYVINENGAQSWSITLIIEYRVVGGAWTSMIPPDVETTITNASLKPVRRTFYSPQLVPAQYEVRVKRRYGEHTAQLAGTTWEDAATFATLRTYQLDPASYEAQRRYGIWVKATGQLSGVIDRLSALAETLVPTWNGAAWANDYSSNPAWLFLYFSRGGFASGGRLLWGAGLADARIDLEAIKLWGAYCAAHGLSYNAVIDRSMSVAEVLNSIARCGRASASWATGKLGVTWDDSVAPVVAQFGMSSIVAGSFEISWASGQLADEIVVQFADEAADFEQAEVRVLKPGVSVPTLTETVQWMGATNEFMAGQMANMLMANNVYRSRSIRFETDAEGLVVSRGDRILLSHDLTQWGYSGRLTAATTTRLDLDREVPRTLGTAAWIALVKPDGTETYHALTDVATGDYAYVTLSVALAAGNVPGTAFPSSPLLDWKWRFDFTATPGKRVKIAALEPLAERRVRLSCVDDPDEYHGMSVLGYTYVAPAPTQPRTPAVSGLNLTETMIVSGNQVLTYLIATWNTSGAVGVTRVRYHGPDGVWIVLGDVVGRRAEFAVQEGITITVEVSVFSPLGQLGLSGVATASRLIAGKVAPPQDVNSFTINGLTLEWSAVSDIDVAGYALRMHVGINRTWENATPVHGGLLTSTRYTLSSNPSGQRTIMVKAYDTSGNESAGPAVIVTNFGDQIVANLLRTVDFEALGWAGTLTGGAIGTGQIEADAPSLMWSTSSARMWGASTATMWLGSYLEMTYTDAVVVAADEDGARMTLAYTAVGETISIWWRQTGTAPMWQTTDTELQWSATDTDSMWALPDFAPWPGSADVVPDTYQLQIRTGAGATQGIVSAFSAVIDVDDIVESFNDVAIGAGGTRLTLVNTYRTVKNVLLTLQDDGGSAATVKAMDKDPALGPLVQCFNLSGTGVTGLIDATIQGY